MALKRAAIFAALFFLLGQTIAFAQDVTLTSPDGSVEISGTLLGFDGEFYSRRFRLWRIDGRRIRGAM